MTAPKRAFDFHEQLELGKTAERFIAKLHDLRDPPPGERRWDLEDSKGRRIELKHDTYPMDATPNFCMERWTCPYGKDRMDGGPWRSREHGLDAFVYLFSNGQVLQRWPANADPDLLAPQAFWFWNVGELVRACEYVCAAMKARGERYQRRIPNVGCFSMCALVPREELLLAYQDTVNVEVYQ